MKVERGFNLYVDVTAACNASCPFCIAPTVGRKDGDGFWKGFQWALDFTESYGGSVQVTGGEPTMSNRLQSVVTALKYRMFHRLVLNTNGTGIRRPWMIPDLKRAGFTHVNFSRHHYWEELNQAVMHIKPESLSENHEFVKGVKETVGGGMMVRINCNLLSGYIDSFEKMNAFVEWCETFGAKSVAFAETFPLGQFDHQLPILPGYAESHAVDLQRIVSDIDSRYESVKTSPDSVSSVWGHSTWIGSFIEGGHRRFWKTPSGSEISIKTLSGWNQDGTPKPPSYSKADDMEINSETIFFAVVHPDGVVTASWDKRERLLFAPSKNLDFVSIGVR